MARKFEKGRKQVQKDGQGPGSLVGQLLWASLQGASTRLYVRSVVRGRQNTTMVIPRRRPGMNASINEVRIFNANPSIQSFRVVKLLAGRIYREILWLLTSFAEKPAATPPKSMPSDKALWHSLCSLLLDTLARRQ